MKYIKTPHWSNKRHQDGLLFFAQILNEALFDYTLDTYKPQALNIRLLCIEALQTIKNISSGLIKKPNIDSVIAEMIWSLKSDVAAKEIVGTRLDGIIEKINSNKTNHKRLEQSILLLYHHFDNRKYLEYIQKALIELVPENKQKEKIFKLTRSYITEIINYGYNPSNIYYNVNRFFFDYSSTFSDTTPKGFFDLFNFENKEFTVIYKVSKLFEEFSEATKSFDFEIVSEYTNTELIGDSKKFLTKKSSELFAVFKEIKAFDEISARIQTENALFKVGNLFSFYHHKETPKIGENALVINNVDKSARLVMEPIKSIIKKADVKPRIAAQKVRSLSSLELPGTTIERISRAIDLHSISLTSEQIENKLLTLWTAIETLIPKDIECGDDRIVQIIKALKPFQELKYLNKLIEQAGNDFWFFDNSKSKKIINKVVLNKKENSFFSLAALIMTKENENVRSEVYTLLNNYPLLRFRLFTLNKNLSTGKGIKKILEDHKQKVEWQIRRIYRVRNLIVHSGKMPSYTNILVENLHNYFDDLLNYIINISIKEKRIKTVTQAILNAEIECDILKKTIDSLAEKDTTLNNYSSVL